MPHRPPDLMRLIVQVLTLLNTHRSDPIVVAPKAEDRVGADSLAPSLIVGL